MIGDLLFFVKVIVGTFVLVLLMQIKVGEGTVEEHTMHWLRNSPVVAPIDQAAQGGVVMIREAWQRLTSGINTRFSKSVDKGNMPGSRSLGLSIERSRTYLKEQAKKATNQIKEELRQEAHQQIDQKFDGDEDSSKREAW